MCVCVCVYIYFNSKRGGINIVKCKVYNLLLN